MAETLGALYLVFVLFALVVGVLWVLLPFAVFKIKDQMKHACERLASIEAELKKSNSRQSSP